MRLLERVVTHVEYVTAPHWRTADGLDRVKIYACNDQVAYDDVVVVVVVMK
jgi:hypothetical protein